MLLNCTRLTHGCTSLRVSKIRRAVTAENFNIRFGSGSGSYNSHLQRLQTLLRPLNEPQALQLLRHHCTVARRLPATQKQQLLGARWMWVSRVHSSIRRGLAQHSKREPNAHNVEISPVKMPKSEYARLLSLAKSEKYVLLAGIGCLIVSSAITMSVPFVLGKVIDVVFNKSGLDSAALASLREYSFMLFWVFVLGGVMNFSRVYLFSSAALRMVRELRSRVYRSMLMQEVGWFDTKGSGELINRLSNDTFMVGRSLSQNVSDGLRSLAMIGVGTGMMIYTSPQLALVSALVVPAMAGIAIVYGRAVRRITRSELDKYAEIMKYAEERFGNVKTVKTFCREQQECETFDRKLDEALEIGYKEVRAKSIFFGLTGFSGNFIIISVLYYGGTLVLADALTIGALASFMIYAGYVSISMNGLSNFYSELNKGVGAGMRIWEILDRKYTIPIDQGLVPQKKPIGEVVFQAVDFNFPSRPDSKVLSEFSLTLLPGQTTAVVGRSGSGKTTIASLLLRLYDPQGGSVLLDGVDLRTLNPQWLRSNVGAVTQEPVLFSGSIRENILYGLNQGEQVSEELLQQVVREAHVDEFTSHLPDGLETLVGQRGMMLSGGQKQRVAIARALIKNPIILILDEATSALDSVSEELVQRALDQLVQGRTVLTIAHRLSTIRNADKIAVLENGQIVEQGSYDELMGNRDGAFRELVSKQAFGANRS
ncbi:ATP-binding cassette sub-family B member 10, mitochondrial [Scaptodrosophila lebanonensis]|uniref:ATP-binding cassette sub-family B member 10, mitochondrial n=1 Tax=Drosophila lebanonensis TaxID=7225 RepID=A0A6J2TSV3_DROLE|nr:ATP-binding cassette sub-family B member 10, mitochondrial [Scaptodrosophila lebanonensis]